MILRTNLRNRINIESYFPTVPPPVDVLRVMVDTNKDINVLLGWGGFII